MTVQPSSFHPTLVSLQRRWVLFAVISLLVLVGGYWFFAQQWSPSSALRWSIFTAAAAVYLLVILWHGLKYNHRPGEKELFPSFGPGNAISLARGLGLACLAGFVFLPPPPGLLAWLPALLYTSAVLADFFDGYLARLTHQPTRLGEYLDINLDGLGVLAAAWLVVRYGQAPAWYLTVALARYAYMGGIFLRKKAGLPVYDLPPSLARRLMAGIQMGFAAALLMPIFSPPGTHVAAALFAVPFLAGFARDWLFASGVLSASRNHSQGQLSRLATHTITPALIVLLRAAAGSLLAWTISQAAAGNPPSALPPALQILNAIVLLLLMLGAAGRSAAGLGLVLIGFEQTHLGFGLSQAVRLLLFTAVLYLGTGPYSLWKPEDWLIFRDTGEGSQQKENSTQKVVL